MQIYEDIMVSDGTMSHQSGIWADTRKINDFIYIFATSDIWIYCFIDVKMEQ